MKTFSEQSMWKDDVDFFFLIFLFFKAVGQWWEHHKLDSIPFRCIGVDAEKEIPGTDKTKTICMAGCQWT